ncbi:MAG TPA: GNAT family N-acetyltransferase, partial [Chloroflexota bacterium]|nr:GNAT family N-acetyltransferase [Chloroflexota bacterium]
KGVMAVEERFKEIEGGFELELVEGEEKVASLGVGRYTMRLAGAEVLMGGIWGVVTHPAHRGRGFGAQMMRATVGRLRAERFPISLLWGISDFYHRFGYAPVLPGYSLTVTTRNAERLGAGPDGVTVRPGTPTDAPALADLYHRTTVSRTGTLRRSPNKCRSAFDPTPPRETDNWWRHTRRVLVVERGGPPLGYALLHGNPAQLSVVEVVVPEEHVETAGVALLAALTREAVERREAEIKLSLPPDDPLAQLLRRAGCKAEVNYPANGGGMGRIVDLPALADAIAPGLAERAAALPGELRPSALELLCAAQGEEPEQRATIQLGAGGGRVARLALPQQRLCQLLLGYQGIDALRRERPDACDDADVPLIRALLPEGYPHMWSIDHF